MDVFDFEILKNGGCAPILRYDSNVTGIVSEVPWFDRDSFSEHRTLLVDLPRMENFESA